MMTDKDMPGSVSVLDIPLYDANIPSAVNLIIAHAGKTQQNWCVSATGAHGLVYAKQNSAFRKVLESFFINLPDGMPGVWVGRLKGAKKMERCYGPDFFMAVMKATTGLEINHFFCGGTDGVAEELRNSVRIQFGNDHVTGVLCPPFLPVDQYDYPSIADKISRCKADVVWIGLSTPKQEVFAHNLAKHTRVSFIVTVGAAFDFHTGRVRQAPKVFQKAGLEWLFRLLMEPKRLYKRYFEIVPLFIYYNSRELAKFAAFKLGLKK